MKFAFYDLSTFIPPLSRFTIFEDVLFKPVPLVLDLPSQTVVSTWEDESNKPVSPAILIEEPFLYLHLINVNNSATFILLGENDDLPLDTVRYLSHFNLNLCDELSWLGRFRWVFGHIGLSHNIKRCWSQTFQISSNFHNALAHELPEIQQTYLVVICLEIFQELSRFDWQINQVWVMSVRDVAIE